MLFFVLYYDAFCVYLLLNCLGYILLACVCYLVLCGLVLSFYLIFASSSYRVLCHRIGLVLYGRALGSGRRAKQRQACHAAYLYSARASSLLHAEGLVLPLMKLSFVMSLVYYFTLSCLVFFYLALSCFTVLFLPCLVFCPVLSCLCHVLSSLVFSCLVL